MTQCKNCKTMKKADECIKCATEAMEELKNVKKSYEGAKGAYKQQTDKREERIATLIDDRARLANQLVDWIGDCRWQKGTIKRALDVLSGATWYNRKALVRHVVEDVLGVVK